MNIKLIGKEQIIMSNPDSKHCYFGWPTVTRLQNGKIAVVASGFRLTHICPFGKTVISYSEDEGKTYTLPAPVIDTVLDDRDGGIMTFGKSGVILTSFNNTIKEQRNFIEKEVHWPGSVLSGSYQWSRAYSGAYLDTLTKEDEQKYLGATFKVSNDCAVTFGEIHKSPVTSPHGPCELEDGSIVWVGRTFMDTRLDNDCICAYRINPDFTMDRLGVIEDIYIGGVKMLSCEPHTIALGGKKLLTHIRVQCKDPKVFTVFQSVSEDGGVTWSKPIQLIEQLGGSPPHIFRHSSGALVCTYGYREAPYGIKAMFSFDEGESWDAGYDVYVDNVDEDLGYPSTIELEDKSLLTVFYAHPSKTEPAVIMQQRWTFEK